jgi:hypothetical protein
MGAAYNNSFNGNVLLKRSQSVCQFCIINQVLLILLFLHKAFPEIANQGKVVRVGRSLSLTLRRRAGKTRVNHVAKNIVQWTFRSSGEKHSHHRENISTAAFGAHRTKFN